MELPKVKKPKYPFQSRIDKELYNLIKNEANKRGMKICEIVEWSLREFLAKVKGKM